MFLFHCNYDVIYAFVNLGPESETNYANIV